MNEFLFALLGLIPGIVIGWHCHAVAEKRRKLNDLKAWRHSRHFFSSTTSKD